MGTNKIIYVHIPLKKDSKSAKELLENSIEGKEFLVRSAADKSIAIKGTSLKIEKYIYGDDSITFIIKVAYAIFEKEIAKALGIKICY